MSDQAKEAFKKWNVSPSNPYLMDAGYYGANQLEGVYDNAEEVVTAFNAGWNAAAEHYAPQLERLARLEAGAARLFGFDTDDYFGMKVSESEFQLIRRRTKGTKFGVFATPLEALAYLDKEGEKE